MSLNTYLNVDRLVSGHVQVTSTYCSSCGNVTLQYLSHVCCLELLNNTCFIYLYIFK